MLNAARLPPPLRLLRQAAAARLLPPLRYAAAAALCRCVMPPLLRHANMRSAHASRELTCACAPGRTTKLRVEGMRGFSMGPGLAPYNITIYKPEHKGSPAQIRMYHCESKSNPAPGPIAHNGPRSLRAHVHVPACAHVVCGLRGSIPMCLCARPCAAAATLSAQPLDIPQPLDISLTAGPCAGRRP